MNYRVEYYVNGQRFLTGLTTLNDATVKAAALNGRVIEDES
jgi:hypothetical protein